jgi:hypothetical protein
MKITAMREPKMSLRRRSVRGELEVVDKKKFSHTNLKERKRFYTEGTEKRGKTGNRAGVIGRGR